MTRKVLRLGIALMVLSVLANPRTVGLTVSPDGSVESGTSLALILVLMFTECGKPRK